MKMEMEKEKENGNGNGKWKWKWKMENGKKKKNGKGKRRELCRLPFSMKKMNALAAYLPNKYSDVKQTKCIMR